MIKSNADSFASKTVDYARALAILLVLLTHTGQQIRKSDNYTPGEWVNSLKNISEAGAAGVPLFFVISGFLMAFLHRNNFSQKVFWKKRFARIYPLWLFWTLVAVLSAYFPITFLGPEPIFVYGHGVTLDSTRDWGLLLLQLTFMGWVVPNIWNSFVVGGWSIQAEMGNYSLFAIFRRVKLGYLLLAVAFISLFYYFYLKNFVEEEYLNVANAAVTSPYWFFLGIFIAEVLQSNNLDTKIGPLSWVSLIVATLSTLFLDGPFTPQYISLLVVVVSIGASMFLASRESFQWLRTIGKYSYGMYFAHFLFILPLNRAHAILSSTSQNSVSDLWAVIVMALGYVFVVCGSLLVAMITFRFIESPIIDWSRKSSSPKGSN